MDQYLQEIIQGIHSLKDAIFSLKPDIPWYKEPITILSFIIATVIVNFFTIYKTLKELGNQKKLFIEGQNLKERDDIRHQLNNFFGPLKEIRTESKILYNYFALEEKAAATQNSKYFRTLRHLAQGNNFSPQDSAILDKILTLAKKKLNLIEKEGWIVKNSQLAELLGKLGAHIRLLLLTAEHKLDGMSAKLEDIVFPLEIDGAIETEIKKLQDRYEELLKPFNRIKNPMELDKVQRKTISYYNRNSIQYFRETAYIDLEEIYREFRKYIPSVGTILDAGCRVGRDTRYYIKHGYKVISFDASIEMVKLCRQYPFAYCLHKSFEEIDYIEEFDGIWACASLVHLSLPKLREALLRLANAAKTGGAIYFSLKVGNGVLVDRGKTTYYYNEDDIDRFMTKELMFELIKKWKNLGKKLSDIAGWDNYLYRKPIVD